MLYPLKFTPILKRKIWGGTSLYSLLRKGNDNDKDMGESWELSGVQGDVSIVSNGYLSGNSIEELIEIYMGELVGDSVYDKFGQEFPLLFKFIDANDVLSVQVHPDDKMAAEKHNAYGKTELWYVVDAKPDSKIYTGFNKTTDAKTFSEFLNQGNVEELLNVEDAKSGDVFFLPAGRIHAIGAGVLLAEIQQTSDITYRVFDWNRKDDKGKSRELHTELALEALDFKKRDDYKTEYEVVLNQTSNITTCDYFVVNILEFDQPIQKDYSVIDSFVVYMCLEGSFVVSYGNGVEKVEMGDTILIPADLDDIGLQPESKAKILEIFIKN